MEDGLIPDRRLEKRNMCDGKRRHHTARCACKEIAAMRHNQEFMQPYRCFYCGKWHVGHIIKDNGQ